MIQKTTSYDFVHKGFAPNDRFGVICIKMSGIIDHVSFAQHLLPRMKKSYELHNEVRLVVAYDGYSGWSSDSFAEEMLHMSPYRHHIKKLALINAPAEVLGFPIKQLNKVSPNVVRHFSTGEIEEALLWANV
ncbi:MAG: STAS/SEC14 domain-containing protein [Alphaproteobacteria bacterium]|nr:hypothetical protein [Alphaproteobacteria bacterium]MCS5597126.1 STAS/SEC14 domain-containing protein [Alphaproteobacteria bacterium]|tara:strand:- start:732 stop:1127 length:396 start_codon:yes stop_codon:yes gene_type:complete